ncbi:MAG: ATP-dependent helicase HrpB [Gemmatimonadota bacterium]
MSLADEIPNLKIALKNERAAVLQAPPGAGKTTLVPLALLDEPWLAGRRIILLQPRRLAARAAAHRMSHLLGQRVGETVGYRIRRDSRVSASTRIEVVTEGILTRFINRDPTLDGIGLLIFDEFHERSLHADVGLALALESRRLVRPDLGVLIMSATVAAERVAELLGCAVLRSHERQHEVIVSYLPPRSPGSTTGAVASAVNHALANSKRDVLVFLPGEREIRATAARLELPDHVDVFQLFGNLPFSDQDRALRPASPGRRKVVLATSIAETSLTIEGVDCVVDSGLSRIPRFSPRTGMTELDTVRVTAAAAEQRRGRAGRLGPGMCLRLWPESEQSHLVPYPAPEIADADLAPLLLELAAAGVRDHGSLQWLDPPPPARLASARKLLVMLGAIDPGGRLAPHGARMVEVGLHPRLAHMVIAGRDMACGDVACDLAAILDGRDFLATEREHRDVDLRTRITLLAEFRATGRVPHNPHGARVIVELLERADADSRALRREVRVATASGDPPEATGRLVALAYPDRVAQRRPGGDGKYILRSGTGVSLPLWSPLNDHDYIAVAATDGRMPEPSVYLAAPLDAETLQALAGDEVSVDERVFWDQSRGSVRAVRQTKLGALTLRSSESAVVDLEAAHAAVLAAVRRADLNLLNLAPAASLLARLCFMHAHDASWPDVSMAALLASVDQWLGPQLWSVNTSRDLDGIDVRAAIATFVGAVRVAQLDALAPLLWQTPAGSKITIDYTDPATPAIRVRLQEMFGLDRTPSLLGGRIPMTLHLLSPANRPVQITSDLGSFWRSSYADVRRDMRGRYPKHHWPEDPLTATPVRGVRKRTL